MLRSRAILAGWAVASFEAGVVLSSMAHFATTPWFLVMAWVGPLLAYGWVARSSASFRIASRLPWDGLALAGIVVLLHLRRQVYVGANGMVWIAAGGVVSFLFWLALRPDKESKLRQWMALAFFAYILLRLRQFSHTQPNDKSLRGWTGLFETPFSLGQDWGWIVAGIVVLLGIFVWRVRVGEKNASLVRKISFWGVLVPPLSLLWLAWVTSLGPVLGLSPTQVPPKDAPTVVLVSWDTVRADSLPLFGGGGLETPNLDSLAVNGTLFTRFHTPAPITAPAHNSMLTGMFPPSHGLRANGETAPILATPRLPEVFRDSGWSTAGFVSVQPVLGRDRGFPVGFQYFDDRPLSHSTWQPMIHALGFLKRVSAIGDRLIPDGMDFAAATTPGSTTTARALAWLEETEGPVFLWVHLFDAHDPREKTEEFRPFLAAARARAEEGPHALNPECEESLVEQRGEIAFLDHQLGLLLDGLRRRDPGLANTVLALVADHGECFGEGVDQPDLYGEGGIKVLHVPSLYQATQHVVGVIQPPADFSSITDLSHRADDLASHVDLFPTLCELAGLAIPEGLQGRSLVPVMAGQTLPDRPIYMEAFGAVAGQDRLVGMVTAQGWKIISTLDGRVQMLHSLMIGDGKDFSVEEKTRLLSLQQRLQELRSSLPVVERGQVNLDAATEAQLSGLGYVSEDEDDAGNDSQEE